MSTLFARPFVPRVAAGLSSRTSATAFGLRAAVSALIQSRSIFTQSTGVAGKAQDVGIVAADIYFPQRFVSQEKLEQFDGVQPGRYTIGLDQQRMSFCGDREDISSICMSAVQRLMDNFNISPRDIGRLEIGTETVIDKSKSVKTALMQLFEESGNTNIEGIDTTNACYGGTQALMNSLAWVESSAWDGRYAIAVAADIAVYEKGNARPTGGCGAVAMLIGPKASLVAEPGLRYSYVENAYDFYKPRMLSEYPVVDGQLSIQCYFRALDSCYRGYQGRLRALLGESLNAKDIDYMCFHTPYNKLVQKSYARLLYLDAMDKPGDQELAALEKFRALSADESYVSKDLEKAIMTMSRKYYDQKVLPSTHVSRNVGNMYCGSLYGGLMSLVDNVAPADLKDKRVMMFSYGSGLAATLFSLKVNGSTEDIRIKSNVMNRLAARTEATPEEFTDTLEIREQAYPASDYTPREPISSVDVGSYYLESVDNLHRRYYERRTE